MPPDGQTPGNETPERPVDALFTTVYEELRRLAARKLTAERSDHTLSATALVHEVYLKLADQGAAGRDRSQFLGVAAQAMRRILVDYARQHRALKRPPRAQQVSLAVLDSDTASLDIDQDDAERSDFLIALDDALSTLGGIEERLVRVVEYRFFAGLTERETADALGVTSRTVTRDWSRARGWLHQRLRVPHG